MFTIKQNDTRPKLLYGMTASGAVLSLASSAATPLLASLVMFKMRFVGSLGAPQVNATAAIPSAAGGVVQHTWTTAHTATAATYSAEWEILWSDGGVQTVPNDTEFTIVVRDDLD